MTVHRKPEEVHEFDLVIIGGGLAGLCAAIAAARHGTKTAIIQDRPVFGGNASSEIRVVPHGCAHSNAWTGETGIVMEIINEDRANNHIHFFDHGMINSLWDFVLLEKARQESNLTSYMNTAIYEVETEETPPGSGYARRILAVHGRQTASEKELTFKAKHYMDATGDATVGFLAGAEFRYGREARSEFNENLAPITADEGTMGSTITMLARDIGKPVPYNPPPWIYVYESEEDIGLARKLYHVGRPLFGGYWWVEVCSPFHQIDDITAIRQELHRHVLGLWNYIKNYSPDKEKAANYALEWVGMIPGKRESRRLVGDVIITEKDLHNDPRWPDGVAYAGWWIDLHMPGGILNKANPGEREDQDDNYKHWIRISPTSLPLRAYYSKDIQNLWMAGRCLSASHVGLGPVRVMLSLALQGQAVGTAAAYAVQHDLTPRQAADPDGVDIQVIRQHLLRDDVHVLGLRNQDPSDLARTAQVSATSDMPLDFGPADPNRWMPLNLARAQVAPLTHERVETVEYYLKNTLDHPVSVQAEIEPLERIWDRPAGESIAVSCQELPPGFEGWLRFPMDVTVTPFKPYRLILRQQPGVFWAYGTLNHPGTVPMYLYESPGGPEAGNHAITSLQPDQVEIPAYRHWRQTREHALAVRITPQPRPFGATMVNNGCAWPEDLPNLWISDPAKSLPQSVSLAFEKTVLFNTVLVSFDTNLDAHAAHKTEFWRAPQSARHWRLLAQVHGVWQQVYEETNNYHRRCTARFNKVAATALKLEILSTNGGPTDQQARVYEIRVYNETM